MCQKCRELIDRSLESLADHDIKIDPTGLTYDILMEWTRLDKAVGRFSHAMRKKLFAKLTDDWAGWDNKEMEGDIRASLQGHTDQIDGLPPEDVAENYVDIANLAMMLFFLAKKGEINGSSNRRKTA
jgi:hypothetical protein